MPRHTAPDVLLQPNNVEAEEALLGRYASYEN